MGDENSRDVTTVKQYLEWVGKTVVPTGHYAFRGQEDAAWSLECGASLRLRKRYASQSKKEAQQRFVQYHRLSLIKQARHEGFDQNENKELGDFEILAKLQHLGSATCLLDFTRSSLVALWFACQPRTEKCKETNGKVFSVNTNDRAKFRELTRQDAQGKDNFGEFFTYETLPRNIMSWYWEPPIVADVAPRMLRQHSLFIFGHMVLPEETAQSVVIPAANKTDILEELCSQHDITRETLFKDIYGFADANSRKSPLLTGVDTSEDYIRSGTNEFNRENFEASIQSFDQAIYLEPERAQLYFSRAYAKAALGQAKATLRYYEEAIKDYDISIGKLPQKLGPEDLFIEPTVLFNRGNARVQLRDFDAAIEDYRKCTEEKSDDLEKIIWSVNIESVYFNLANVLAKIQRWEEAITEYKKAISRKSDFRDAYYNLGNTEARRGNYQEALVYYGEAIDVDENYIHAWQNQAATRALLNNLETAMEEFLEHGTSASNKHLVEEALAGRTVMDRLDFVGNIGNIGATALFDLSPGKGSTGDPGFSVPFHWPQE